MNNHSDDESRAAAGHARKTLWKTLGLSFLGGFGTPIVKHPDERIAATSQRWAAISGAFLSITLGIDMMVRILILKQDFRLCWDICMIWMVNLLLVSIGMIRSGVQPVGAVGKWSWKTSGLMIAEIALLVPAVLWLMGMIHSLQAYLGGAALAGGSGFVTLIIMRGIYGRWERRALGSPSDDEAGSH